MRRRLFTIFGSAALVAGLALTGAHANAQTGSSDSSSRERGRRMGPDQHLQRLSERLNLTDDQKNQVRPILEDRHQQMQAIRSDTSLSRQERMSKMRSVMEDSNNKIRALLKDDQKQKFDQMQQQWRARMHKHGGD